MPQHHKLCIVIADGGHARFVRPAEDNGLHAFEAADSATLHKHTSDLVSDRPGRSFESGSPTRHAFTSRTDPHAQEKVRFTKAVAEMINESSAADDFNELVIVAPSTVLAELQDDLNLPTKAKLLGVLAKDLTKVPDHELQPHLKEWVRPVHRA